MNAGVLSRVWTVKTTYAKLSIPKRIEVEYEVPNTEAEDAVRLQTLSDLIWAWMSREMPRIEQLWKKLDDRLALEEKKIIKAGPGLTERDLAACDKNIKAVLRAAQGLLENLKQNCGGFIDRAWARIEKDAGAATLRKVKAAVIAAGKIGLGAFISLVGVGVGVGVSVGTGGTGLAVGLGAGFATLGAGITVILSVVKEVKTLSERAETHLRDMAKALKDYEGERGKTALYSPKARQQLAKSKAATLKKLLAARTKLGEDVAAMKKKHLAMGQGMKKLKADMARLSPANQQSPKLKQLAEKWLVVMEEAANFGTEIRQLDEMIELAERYRKDLAEDQLPKSSWLNFERVMFVADAANSLYSSLAGLGGLCK